MKAVGSIQARMGSSRLPGKVLLPLGEARVVELVADAVGAAKSVDPVVLTTGDGPENRVIVEWCHRKDIKCRIGPEENLLERHLDVGRATNASLLVRITGDCPFVPPREIERVVRIHRDNDARYTTNVTDQMPIGTAVDAINCDLLEDLLQEGENHPVRLLRAKPEEWSVEVTPNPVLTEFSDAHLAVDTPEDYWRLTDAVNAVGTEPLDVSQWVSEQSR